MVTKWIAAGQRHDKLDHIALPAATSTTAPCDGIGERWVKWWNYLQPPARESQQGYLFFTRVIPDPYEWKHLNMPGNMGFHLLLVAFMFWYTAIVDARRDTAIFAEVVQEIVGSSIVYWR